MAKKLQRVSASAMLQHGTTSDHLTDPHDHDLYLRLGGVYDEAAGQAFAALLRKCGYPDIEVKTHESGRIVYKLAAGFGWLALSDTRWMLALERTATTTEGGEAPVPHSERSEE